MQQRSKLTMLLAGLSQFESVAVITIPATIIGYTISIGLTASRQGKLDNIENLLAHADLALYQARRDGCCRTAVFNHPGGQVAAG